MFKITVKIKITVVKYMHKISQRLHPFYVLLGFALSMVKQKDKDVCMYVFICHC